MLKDGSIEFYITYYIDIHFDFVWIEHIRKRSHTPHTYICRHGECDTQK